MSKVIKPIAIYLPQFHPIPENDEWWGKGFTEWTNVTKATPRFEGHYQPHLPADLGFYDLRLEDARLAQEAMAKQFGIYGFCYYHYWFSGKRLLHEPLDRKLKNDKEDFPFMLCWANENWTRTWISAEQDVLLRQDYSEADDLNHILHLLTYFKDSRYIKVNGKPIFILYRYELFPDIEKTIKLWKDEVKKAGFPDLYIGFARKSNLDIVPDCFDFAFEFQPSYSDTPQATKASYSTRLKIKVEKLLRIYNPAKLVVHDYEAYSKVQMNLKYSPAVYPGITPMWDNAARKENYPFILKDSTPEKYGAWLSHIKSNYKWELVPEPFLFINAWNEWAEGNHLEPCQKWKSKYLEVTQEVLENRDKS
ncbi:glycosyltransferase WbsX family protein [Flavobacterium algicola]|uniref:glycosyltransferase WbsX family protein n=1 Tax=Flavobacterium algicola TaxID=556529 RepID=UPI001EFE414F|nr:glycoside hydrolase family 99-like domain-containing protein [Flavobacterium algicola]MCG9793894.1 glycoside hydrolase family 99-like domain-containing protein [Flavobacterium algicola]